MNVLELQKTQKHQQKLELQAFLFLFLNTTNQMKFCEAIYEVSYLFKYSVLGQEFLDFFSADPQNLTSIIRSSLSTISDGWMDERVSHLFCLVKA